MRRGSTKTGPVWDRQRVACSIAGCAEQAVGRGWCSRHWQRWKAYGDPEALAGLPTGPNHRAWTDVPSYTAIHERIRKARGPARNYLCPCGAQARQWSWQFGGPWRFDELRGLAYSTDFLAYEPRCFTCHKRDDNDRIAAHPETKPCHRKQARHLCPIHA